LEHGRVECLEHRLRPGPTKVEAPADALSGRFAERRFRIMDERVKLYAKGGGPLSLDFSNSTGFEVF
jgi:hypothetical protein